MTSVHQPELNGLETEKVSVASNSMRFFPGGGRDELLDQIVHLTRYGSMVVNIQGEAGLGKSQLLHAVKVSLPGTAVQINASLLMSGAELLNQLLHQLMTSRFHHELPELPSVSDEKALLSVIQSYLLRLNDSGGSIVFLIDDAHELSEDALKLLFGLLLNKQYGASVSCVLFSEPYMETLLKKEVVQDSGGEQVFTMKMPSMDLNAIIEYLSFLEAVKPESERILYSGADQKLISDLSEGKLGQVNAAIRSLLEREKPAVKTVPKFFSPKAQYGLLALVALVLGGVVFFYQADKSSKQDENDGLVGEPIRITPEPMIEPDGAGNSVAPDEEQQSSSLLQQLRKKQEELLEKRAQEQRPVLVSQDEGEQLATGQELVGSSRLKSQDSAPVSTPTAAKNSAEAERKTTKKPVVEKAAVEKTTVEKTALEKKVTTPVEVKPTSDVNDYKRWIGAQPGNYYTIQILGAHSKDNVSKYVARFKGDKSKLAVYEGVLRNKPWYVLIYGSFENRDLARDAGSKLGLKDVWIRSFSSIQKEMIR